MTNYILLVFPILLLLMTFAGCKRAPQKSFSDEIWDKNQAHMIQAFACIGVILHHLTQRISSYGDVYVGPITILSSMGILFTSLFFFFSGYGLITSHKNNPRYLNGFLSHRIPIILVPFFVANICFIADHLLFIARPMSRLDIIQSLFGYILLNGNGWYIVEILFLYLAFYFIFKHIKNADIAAVLLTLFAFYLIRKGFISGHDNPSSLGNHWFKGEWWYNSTIVFVMGVWFARFKDKIVCGLKKHYALFLVISITLFLYLFYWEEKVRNRYGYYRNSVTVNGINGILLTLISQSILCIVFTLLILLINMKITIGNRVLKFISSISIELFLIHNMFLEAFFGLSKTNYILIYFAVLVCGIGGAYILHLIDKPLIAGIQKLFSIKSKISKKQQLLCLLVIAVLISAIMSTHTFVIRPYKDFKSEMTNFANAKEGDIVSFGRYESDTLAPGKEHIKWTVLFKEGNTLMLLAEEGLDGGVYYSNHKPTSWQDSDLRKKVNTEMYNSMFSKKEKNIIIENPESGDNLSILSEKEALDYFTDDASRQLIVTSAAQRKGTNINTPSKMNDWDFKDYHTSWWWLRSNETDIFAPIVSVDGEILSKSKYVNKPNGAIRPVVWISFP